MARIYDARTLNYLTTTWRDRKSRPLEKCGEMVLMVWLRASRRDLESRRLARRFRGLMSWKWIINFHAPHMQRLAQSARVDIFLWKGFVRLFFLEWQFLVTVYIYIYLAPCLGNATMTKSPPITAQIWISIRLWTRLREQIGADWWIVRWYIVF